MVTNLKQDENGCRYCPKVFCCPDCREAHEKNKHPKPKCSLCVKKPLPFKPNPSDDSNTKSQLIGHIISEHLPLHCKLCGEEYHSRQDIDAAEACKFWAKRRARKQQELTAQAISLNPEPSLIVIERLQATPKLLPQNKSSQLINSSSISRLKQNSLDSPPELARQTSTPMHGLGSGHHQQLQASAPPIPQLLFKTPSSFDATGSACSSVCSRGSSGYSSKYYTGIDEPMGRLSVGSINNNEATTGDNQSVAGEPSWSTTPSWLVSRKAGKERSIMKPDVLERISRFNNNDSSIEKRVRFSDQCALPTGSPDSVNTSLADNDIFFEARESLDEPAKRAPENQSACSCCCRKGDVSSFSGPACDAAKKEEKVESAAADSSVDGNKSTASSSSRLLMMLLVEKTDSKALSSMDLAPLIDSGLKKLEESVASANSSANIDKGSHESSAETAARSSASALKAVSIKDSFVSISSDRVELYSRQSQEAATAAAAAEEPPPQPAAAEGIFSVVARVVRCALKKLPAVGGVTTRNLSREPLATGSLSTSSSSLSISSSEVVSVGPASAALSTSQILLQRSASKRPRERLDSGDEPTRNYSPGSNSSSRGASDIISSPAAKRYRGRYRIRAREPIARMRERHQQMPVSPRGASRETQRFQQGTLSIGDTFLPLPSRAHQSTQTEN